MARSAMRPTRSERHLQAEHIGPVEPRKVLHTAAMHVPHNPPQMTARPSPLQLQAPSATSGPASVALLRIGAPPLSAHRCAPKAGRAALWPGHSLNSFAQSAPARKSSRCENGTSPASRTRVAIWTFDISLSNPIATRHEIRRSHRR